MNPTSIDQAQTFAALPPEWPEDPMPAIRAALSRWHRKVVVLDDDPTGTQTVHDTPVLTEWTIEALASELAAPGPVFYILTNSRSLRAAEAVALNEEIARHLTEVARRTRVRPRFAIAKGGITSSDIATHGFGVRRAFVRGQILPGVPVWELGPESRHPGLVYVVFPGNVGGPKALAEVVRELDSSSRH